MSGLLIRAGLFALSIDRKYAGKIKLEMGDEKNVVDMQIRRQASHSHHKSEKGFQRFRCPLRIAANAIHFAVYGFVLAEFEYNASEIGSNTL
ncbi:hypothetical protein [Epilithonimonas sp.]|uniref:hypothetical protein n=1 Tax=Epilithonimonas sp. TaxID=2894511 RepID=UPI0028AB31D4|nr:hypothetical protein [Epilithonimonas sp.]